MGVNECIEDPGTELIEENIGTIGHCYETGLTLINKEEYEDIIDENG